MTALFSALSILAVSYFMSLEFDEVDFDCSPLIYRCPKLTRGQRRSLLLKTTRPPVIRDVVGNHERSLDSDFLMDIEPNPGPKGTSSGSGSASDGKKKAHQNKQRNMNVSLKDQLAKALAEIDVHKEKVKETIEKFNEPLVNLKMETDMIVQEQKKKQAILESENGDNSVTFPDLIPKPDIIDPNVYKIGVKRKGIYICDVQEKNIESWTKWYSRFCVYCMLTFASVAITFSVIDWAVFFNIENENVFGLESAGFVSLMIVLSQYPVAMISAALYFAYSRPVSIKLVGVPVATNMVVADDRPEFDRGDKLAPQQFVDYKLFVELRYGDEYLYLDHKKQVFLPSFWFEEMGSATRLKILHLNVGLMASALNRKTLGLKCGGSKDAARIERSFRLVSSNAAYQEDYNRLLQDGSSSYSDMQLFAGTVLSGDPTVNPVTFC